MTIQGSGPRALLIALIGLLSIGAGSAWATSAHFLPSPFAVGFDATEAGFPTDVDYVIPTPVAFVDAGAIAGAGVDYDLSQCLLLGGAGACDDTLSAGSDPYTAVVTLTLTSVSQAIPEQGILLFLSGLANTADAPPYDEDNVGVVLDPGPIAGYDFAFTPFETITWTSGSSGTTYYYLGFRMFQIGDSVTLRYDVSSQLVGGTPVIETNASYTFVPEPSTAVLMALGLAGLALRRRR